MPHPLLADSPGETRLLLGNEAIVRGAIEAGIQVVSCYPGTPSSEVPDTFFRMAPDADYSFEYSVNEKVALEVAGGATLAGALSLCTMKHVGVNVAADPLLTLTYVGAPGGLVLLSADDPGCHSSQNEQDNRYYARMAGMPCLEPASAQEAKDMTRDGLALSKAYAAPLMLRTTTRVNHLRGPVELGPLPKKAKAPGFAKNPSRFVPIPAFARPMHLKLMDTMEKLRAEAEASPYNALRGSGKFGVIASGISRAYLNDALQEIKGAGRLKILELGFTHPLPQKLVQKFLKGLDAVLVLEELEPLLENDIRVLAHKKGLDVAVHGKDFLPRNGEYTVGMVEAALRKFLGLPKAGIKACPGVDDLPQRPPNLCVGCPHRASYFAVKKVFGDAAVYSSDIGCYTLGILPPLAAADFLICMGSSISAGGGAAKAAGQTVVAFIGDSTFFHSGLTGLVNAVFNRHNLLVVVLDNHTTAMTGHQPHPGVEKTIHGDNEVRLDIEAVCKGLGVPAVTTVSPFNHKRMMRVLEEYKQMDGVRVIIAREPCPLHARRVYGWKPSRVAYIADTCTGRGECIDSLGCPAFSRQDGKVTIDSRQCAGCMVCLQICPNIKARSLEAK